MINKNSYKILDKDLIATEHNTYNRKDLENLISICLWITIICFILCIKLYFLIIIASFTLYLYFHYKNLLGALEEFNNIILERKKEQEYQILKQQFSNSTKNQTYSNNVSQTKPSSNTSKNLHNERNGTYQSSEFHKEIEELLKRRENYLKEKAERKPQREKEYIHTYNLINFLTPTLSDEKVSRNFIKNFPNLTYSSIRKNTPIKKLENFISIDLETTGLRASTDEIIEISAVKFINGEATECLSTLIKPKKVITEETIKINHITNKMVENAPKIQQVIPAFKEFIKGSNIIGYNLEFDLKFLYVNGLDFFDEKRQYFDVLKICKTYLKDTLSSYKLDNVCEFSELYRTNAHRASEDAFATGLIFRDIGKKILDPNYNYYE